MLADLTPYESLTMHLKGAGAPGTVNATVAVRFDGQDEATVLSYDADAVVGGMVGGVGQRMLTSVSRRMADQFFGNVEQAIVGGVPAAATPETAAGAAAGAAAAGAAPAGTSFPAPLQRLPVGDNSFLAGILVGGLLVLAGVIVGGILGRRR
jgi:hypothetical protein